MNFINNWLREEILAIKAYEVPNSEGFIKLDAMENPYPIPTALLKQYQQYLAQKMTLNRYPDPQAIALKKALKKHIGVSSKFDILLGNGSDEIIQLLALACRPSDIVASPSPSFTMYDMVAKFTHLKHISLPLNERFELDIDTCLTLINKRKPKIIFLAYPNNPSGNLFNLQHIKTIIKASDALVVIDEAYDVYAGQSFIGELKNYPNLTIMRTLSKMGLAGLRLGFLLGAKPTISQLNKLRLPYNINTLSQLSAIFFLENFTLLNKQIARIKAARELLFQELSKIKLIQTYPSAANFILFRTKNAPHLFNYLIDNKILIKNLSAQRGLENCLRVSVGTTEENHLFLTTIQKFYEQY